MTEQFASRREMREAERAASNAALGFPPLTANQQAQISSAEETAGASSVESQSKTPAIVAEVPAPVSAPAVAKNLFDSVLAEAEEPITAQVQLFSVSPNLNLEPQTASIIVQPVDPLNQIAVAIGDSGVTLKTGSIELPNLSTHTGEIATIEAAAVDEAITQDSIAGFVSTIAPMRASGVVNSSGKIGILPSKRIRGQGQVYLMLSLSIFMVAVGGLILGAYMIGLFK